MGGRRERANLEWLAHTEAIFALSNGHLGLCGNLDEGEPHVTPGTYLNGFFESLPLPHAEGGLWLSGAGSNADRRDERQAAPPACRRRALRRPARDSATSHSCARSARRCPPTRGGMAVASWTSGSHPLDAVGLVRPASASLRSITKVEAVDERARVVVQSVLLANEPLPEKRGDPAGFRPPCGHRSSASTTLIRGSEATLGHRTRSSGLRMVAGLDHVVEGPSRNPHRFGERARPRSRHREHPARSRARA